MLKKYVFLLAFGAMLLVSGCMGIQAETGDRPLITYDTAFEVAKDVVNSYGLIVGYWKYPALGEEGPGLIIADVPKTNDLGARMRTRITVKIKPYSFDYPYIDVRVSKQMDMSEPSSFTASPVRAEWRDVANDQAMEEKLTNEIWEKLAGTELAAKKKLVKDAPRPVEGEKGYEPTVAEKRLEAGLDKLVSMDFTNANLSDAIDFLRNMMGANIVLTSAAQEFINKEKPVVNIKVQDVQCKSAFSLILTQAPGLTWEVAHEVILINRAAKKEIKLEGILVDRDNKEVITKDKDAKDDDNAVKKEEKDDKD
jgi:hypothetical protein